VGGLSGRDYERLQGRSHQTLKTMRNAVLVSSLLLSWSASAQNINFTNKTVTFTNLEGRSFTAVRLVHGDLDGVVWMKESSGGRLCYTNLARELLEEWAIPTNRIAIARARAEHKTVSRAAAIQAAANAQAKTGAAWAAGAPAREQQAKADAIKALTVQIDTSVSSIQAMRAHAQAQQMRTIGGQRLAQMDISTANSMQAEVDNARARLQQMRAEYVSDYGRFP